MESAIINVHCVFDYAIFKDSVVVMGVFDGVHVGHRYLIDKAIKEAKEEGKRCIITTFSKDPDEVVDSKHLVKLQSNFDRFDTLASLGADSVAVMPFTSEFACQTPLQFLACMFLKNTPYSIHVGKNFRFGKGAEGDIDTLINWAEKYGIKVHVHDLFEMDGGVVSSTRVRHLIADGRNDEANALLGGKI